MGIVSAITILCRCGRRDPAEEPGCATNLWLMLCEIETAWPPPGPEEIHWKVPLSGEWVVKFVCLLFCCKAPRFSAVPSVCGFIIFLGALMNACPGCLRFMQVTNATVLS